MASKQPDTSDSESVALVKSFIDWVDCLLEENDENLSHQKQKAIPNYARSKYEVREDISLNFNESVNDIQRTTTKYENKSNDYNQTKYSFVNKALLTVRAHDAMNPSINNSIRKCSAIEKAMTGNPSKPRKKRTFADAEEGIYSDALKLKDRMNSTRIRHVEVIDDTPVVESPVIAEDSATLSQVKAFDKTHLWSEKSLQLESCIRPHVLQMNLRDTWDSDRLCFDFNLLQSLDDSLELGIVDTLFVANTDDYDFHQLSAARDYGLYDHISNSNFSVAKFPVARYSIARIHSNFAYFGGRFRLRRELYSFRDIDDSVYSMLEKRFDSHGPAADMEGILKGVKSSGSIHVRPLCTVGDILVAIHELLDPREFQCGCIQLPELLSAHLHRNYEGVFRYSYDRCKPEKWQFLRWNESLSWLRQYLCPVICGSKDAFQIEDLECDTVDATLRATAAAIMKHFQNMFCMSRSLSQLTIDFEMSIGKGFTHAETDVHFYRVVNISSAKFKDRVAILRRSAVLGIDPANWNYLFQFQEAYASAWRQYKRRQQQKRSSSLKAQSLDSNDTEIDALSYGMMNMDSLRGFSRGTADGGPNSDRPRTGTGRSGVVTPVWRGLRSREVMLAKSGNTPHSARSGHSDSHRATTENKSAKGKYSTPNIATHVAELIQRAVARSSASSGEESEEESDIERSCKRTDERNSAKDAEMRENFNQIHSFIESEDFIDILVSHFIDKTDQLGAEDKPVHAHTPLDPLTIQTVENPNSASFRKPTTAKSLPSPTISTVKPIPTNLSPKKATSETLNLPSTSPTRPQSAVDKGENTVSKNSESPTVIRNKIKPFRARTPPTPTKVDNFFDRSAKLLRDAQRVKRLMRFDRDRSAQQPQPLNSEDHHITELQSDNNETDDRQQAGSSADGDLLNDLAYDIAKVVTTDELFGQFSVKKYMDMDSRLVMRSDLSISADSNDLDKSSNNLKDLTSKTRSWLRRNNAAAHKASSSKPKEDIVIKENVELANNERFQTECDRVMCSIIAGIEPQLGMKIRMGLMKFDPSKFQSKNRKKKNRKSRQMQKEVAVNCNLLYEEPEVAVETEEPEVAVETEEPEVAVETEEPEVAVETEEPEVVVETEYLEPCQPQDLNDETADNIFSEDKEIAGRKIFQFIQRYRKGVVAEEQLLLLPSSPISTPSSDSSSSSSSSPSPQSVRSDKEGVTLSVLSIGNGPALSEKNSAVGENHESSQLSTKERKSIKNFSDSSSDDGSEQELLVGGDRLEYDEFSESVNDDYSINSRCESGDGGRNNHGTEFNDAEGEPQRYLSKKANEIHVLVDEMRRKIRKNFKSFVDDSSLDKENPHNKQLLQRIEAKPNKKLLHAVHDAVKDKLNRKQPRLDELTDHISISDSETEAEVQKMQDSNIKLRKRAIDVHLQRPRNRRIPAPIKRGPKYVLQLDGGAWVDESGFYRTRSPEIHIGRVRKFDQSRSRAGLQKSNETALASQPVLSSNSSSSSCMVSDDSDVDKDQADKLAKIQKKQSKSITRSYFNGDSALTLQDYIILGHSMLKKVDQSMLSDTHHDTQKSRRMMDDFLSKDSMNLEKTSSYYDEKKGIQNQTKNLLSAVKLALISLDGRLLSSKGREQKGEADMKKSSIEHVSKPTHNQLQSHSLRSGSLWGGMLCGKQVPTSNLNEHSRGGTASDGDRVFVGIDAVPNSSNIEVDDQASLVISSTFVASFSNDVNQPSANTNEHDIQHDTRGAAVVQRETISSGPKVVKQTPVTTGKGLYIISESYKSARRSGPVVKSTVHPKTKSKPVPHVFLRNYSSVVLGTPYTTSHSYAEDSWQVLENKVHNSIGTSSNDKSESSPYFPEVGNDSPEDIQAREEARANIIEVNNLKPIASNVVVHDIICNLSEKEINCETPGTQSPLVYSPPSTAHFPRKRELSELSLEIVSTVFEQMLADMNPLLSEAVQDRKHVTGAQVLTMNDDDDYDESNGLGDSGSMKVKEPLLRMGSATWYFADSGSASDTSLLTSPSELSIASKPVTAIDVKSTAAYAQTHSQAKLMDSHIPLSLGGATTDISPKDHIADNLSPLEAFLARSKQQALTVHRNSTATAKTAVASPQQPSGKPHPQKILRGHLTHHQPAARTEFKPEPPEVIISSKIASPTKNSLHRKLKGGT